MEDLAYFESEGASEMAEDRRSLDGLEDGMEDYGDSARSFDMYEDDFESEMAEESIEARSGRCSAPRTRTSSSASCLPARRS